MYKEVYDCRNCSGKLYNILDLGDVIPSNFISNDRQVVSRVPLVLSACEECGLVQLKHTVDLDLMYRKYWYKSGINREMVEHLTDIVRSIEEIIELHSNNIVVDIGCNDGTMLSLYSNHPIKIGYDPAYNLAEEAKKNCSYFINNYFSADYYPLPYKAKVVTAIAMIYDLEDPNKFLSEVKEILDDDGIFVAQFADLYSMLKSNDFSNICHEHIEYYDLITFKTMVENHGFRVFRVQHNYVNGGSLRVYMDLGIRDIDISVSKQLDYEFNLYPKEDIFDEFYRRIEDISDSVYRFITKEKDSGKTISILGASTKGNTILQFFQIDSKQIDYAADTNKEKWGLKTIGTDIEIQGDDFVFDRKPDYMLVLPWFFVNDFISKYNKYLMNGGTFIVPLPEPRMVSRDGWFTLDGKALNKERMI